jgi:hypothetical protein
MGPLYARSGKTANNRQDSIGQHGVPETLHRVLNAEGGDDLQRAGQVHEPTIDSFEARINGLPTTAAGLVTV